MPFSSQTALLNFSSLLLCILLFVCTCTYARATAPGLIDRNKEGYVFVFGCCRRIEEEQEEDDELEEGIEAGAQPPSPPRRAPTLIFPSLLCWFVDDNRFSGLFWKCSRIGTLSRSLLSRSTDLPPSGSSSHSSSSPLRFSFWLSSFHRRAFIAVRSSVLCGYGREDSH